LLTVSLVCGGPLALLDVVVVVAVVNCLTLAVWAYISAPSSCVYSWSWSWQQLGARLEAPHHRPLSSREPLHSSASQAVASLALGTGPSSSSIDLRLYVLMRRSRMPSFGLGNLAFSNLPAYSG
jgi:hypothetical protein